MKRFVQTFLMLATAIAVASPALADKAKDERFQLASAPPFEGHGPDGAEVRAQSPFGRVARPEEVAAAVLYLAAPEAEWASGTIVDLNGASYLRP